MNNGIIKFETGSPLPELHPGLKLWLHWLDTNPDGDSFLPSSFRAGKFSEFPSESAPRRKNFFPSTYAGQLIDDLDFFASDAEDHQLLTQSISDLASGRAGSVVTGQHPGFAGGPLYSLFKIATTVALARRQSQAGRPTVPVFWMGDDDDDWQELLDPVFWDGARGNLTSSNLMTGARETRLDMIGSLPVSSLENATVKAMDSLTITDETALQVVKILKKAHTHDSSLSVLMELVIRCVFKGTGLIILRGNDPRLHSQSGDFYARAIECLPELARLTGEQGKLNAKQFGITPLSANSIRRPLYVVDDHKRQPWDGQSLPGHPSSWRCGVLLRSMLQDWLLEPDAVVVGPGELAYLSQLVPAYEHMGIVRCPLVPRLFGWVLPQDFSVQTIRRFTHDSPLSPARCLEMAQIAGAAGEEKLVQLLEDELGLEESRARDLAAGRTRRWVKGVQALLKNESVKQTEKMRPSKPGWVFPQGQRQERKLAWIPVVTTWGRPLIDALLDASDEHLEKGANGIWNEFFFRVPVPDNWKKEGLES